MESKEFIYKPCHISFPILSSLIALAAIDDVSEPDEICNFSYNRLNRALVNSEGYAAALDALIVLSEEERLPTVRLGRYSHANDLVELDLLNRRLFGGLY